MALPIVLIALLVFSLIMFAISQYQVHETRWTARSLDLQRAFVLADAGMQRAVARHIARPWARRWYGTPPNVADDQLGAANQEHEGRFDESSQMRDETGTSGPVPEDRKLDPRGTYAVLVEDRRDAEFGETQPPPATPDVKLMFTDIYSKATVQGASGRVNALVFARIAICPELNYFTPSETAPEHIKKVIRYGVYFDPKIADLPYDSTGDGTREARERVHVEVARFHQNFLRNRLLFRDLRAQVNAGWNATPGKFTFSKAEVLAFFNGMAPVAPASTSVDQTAGEPFNRWTDMLLRQYRIHDAIEPNRGFRYVIDRRLTPAQEQTAENVVRNILRIFHNNNPAYVPVPDKFRPDSPTPVTDGNVLLDEQRAEDNIADPKNEFFRDVTHWQRLQARARIPKGHFKPFPDTVRPTDTSIEIAKDYHDNVFEDSFKNADGTAIDTMKDECRRITSIGADPAIDPEQYVLCCANPLPRYFPIELRYDLAGATAGTTPTSIPLDELVRFYYKYIETGARFTNLDGEIVMPPPPDLGGHGGQPYPGPPESPPGPGDSGGPGGGTPGYRPNAGPTDLGGSVAGL
jgi:hypothetical protein